MYWENELRCPHCKTAQNYQPVEPLDEWDNTTCCDCKQPFKFMAEAVMQYTTMSPALEAVRQRQRKEMRQLLEKNP